MRYQVSGIAMVPVKVRHVVEAKDEKEAIRLASRLRGLELRSAIVPNSDDESSVCEYEPLEAEIVE